VARCEDYPCCGHGPPPWGDGGGCPDEDGRFDCVLCGRKLPKGASSSVCDRCKQERAAMDPEEREERDRMQEAYDAQWGNA
jgi:hypothetical protein